MSAENVDIFQSRRFEKSFKKLPESLQDIIDDQIDLIIDNPIIGERKKGDLSFLYVHKFKVQSALYLLGYSFEEETTSLTLYLLQVGSHEKFYEEAKRQRSNDLKLIE